MALKRSIENGTLTISDEQGARLLSIREELSAENELVIIVSGELKNEVAFEFEDELMAALTTGKAIVVDFAGVTFISSAGLRALLSAQQMVDELQRASFCIRGLSESVQKTFESTGFIDLIEIKQ